MSWRRKSKRVFSTARSEVSSRFALPLTGLFLLSGRWRVWMSAGATAIVLFALSTALMGPAWFADWLELARTFSRLNVQVNFGELVSWQGVLQALIGEDDRIATGEGRRGHRIS